MQDDKARCPQCGKVFDNDSQVRRHLSQPRTKCHTRPTAFVDPAELLEYFNTGSSSPDSDPGSDTRSHTPCTSNDSSSDSGEGTASAAGTDTPIIDYFPGAAGIVDQAGTKFIDGFDQDMFSDIRNSENLYYPFADRPEWELAEFLLTSGLSMTAIDRFLSLILVSFPY